jgi:hypothetical protein
MAAQQPWPGHLLCLPGALPCTAEQHREDGRRAAELGLGVHARTAEQHREDGSRGGERAVELGGGFGGEHGADPSAAGSRGNEAMARAIGAAGGRGVPRVRWRAVHGVQDRAGGQGER